MFLQWQALAGGMNISLERLTLAFQVLKKSLSMNEPSVMAGNFSYEEGGDLEPDEVASNARLLPLMLDKLPGGGLKHGTIVNVSDQAQDFSCQLVITHKVRSSPVHLRCVKVNEAFQIS